MPRFVVLEHDHPDVHWDLMLESDEILTTWSLPPQPLPLREFQCSTKRLPDHRKRYLDYEGDVSDGRGAVRRIDAGTFDQLDEQRFALYGALFDGTLELRTDFCVFAMRKARKSEKMQKQ